MITDNQHFGRFMPMLTPEQQDARNRLFCRHLDKVLVAKPRNKIVKYAQIPRDSSTNRLSDAS